jgi:SAM-dependent methyltransferase
MTDVEAIVQRYYGDRPVLQRIDDALRTAGVDPERPSHRDLWPFDQLHSRGIAATREYAERARIRAGVYVLDLGCGLGGASCYLATECGCRVAAIDLTPNFVEAARILTAPLWARRSGRDPAGECARLAVPRCYLRSCLVVRCDDEHRRQGGTRTRGGASVETRRALLMQ